MVCLGRVKLGLGNLAEEKRFNCADLLAFNFQHEIEKTVFLIIWPTPRGYMWRRKTSAIGARVNIDRNVLWIEAAKKVLTGPLPQFLPDASACISTPIRFWKFRCSKKSGWICDHTVLRRWRIFGNACFFVSVKDLSDNALEPATKQIDFRCRPSESKSFSKCEQSQNSGLHP